ncbi:MAG: hypothetical protein QOE27_1137 [Solirubrobacteraceae bacterium]|nr:hypothetical protein [Solirubrobacteraceae bacterium]
MATDPLGGAAAGLALALALALVGCLGRRARHPGAGRRGWPRTGALSVLAGLALLAAPVRSSLDIVARNTGDAPQAGAGAEYAAYLHAHRRGAVRYVILTHPCTGGLPCPSTTSWSLRHATRIRGFLYRFAGAGERRGAGAPG